WPFANSRGSPREAPTLTGEHGRLSADLAATWESGRRRLSENPTTTTENGAMEKRVRKDVGVWIDHRKAVIATAGKVGVPIQRIASNMEKHVRFSGGAISGEDIRERRFVNRLERYYAAVTARIRKAESILLLGPGEAKLEFKHHLEREGLGD